MISDAAFRGAAYASAPTALRTRVLRGWLRAGEETGALPDTGAAEARLSAQLERIVAALTRPAGTAGEAPRVRTVVVTVDEGRPGTDAVLASVRAALEG